METPQSVMPQDIAKHSFWEAIWADDLVSDEIRQTPLEFEEAAPFDKIYTDSGLNDLFWEKTFDSELGELVKFPIYLAYLRSLMPELYGVHPGLSKVLVSWITHDLHDVLSDAADSMSDTTKSLLNGSTTLNALVNDFFTPDVIAKVEALNNSGARFRPDEIIRILKNGESVALSKGTL